MSISIRRRGDVPGAEVSDDPIPDEPDLDDLEAKDDDAKDDAKVDDDGDVEMDDGSTTKFDEGAMESDKAIIKTANGTIITASNLYIPKWMKEWKLGTKAMCVEEANSLGSFPRPAEMNDAMIGHWVFDVYYFYVTNFVNRSNNSLMSSIAADRMAAPVGKRAARHDLTGKWPDLGEDEDGNLRDPTEEELRKYHQESHLSQPNNRDVTWREMISKTSSLHSKVPKL